MSLFRSIVSHPANSKNVGDALFKAIRWQLHYRLGMPYLDIDYHGLILRCYPHEHSASRALYFSGLPDYWEMCFIRDYLQPDDLFVDVGANVGLYTLLASSLVGINGQVVAFEPNSISAAKLTENISLNNLENVTVLPFAASDIDSTVKLDLTSDSCTTRIGLESDLNIASDEVKSIRLDGYFEQQEIAMAKLDIEGFEPFALRGATRLLERGNPPVMQIEIAGYSDRYGVTSDQCIAELNDWGYDLMMYRPQQKQLVAVKRHWEIPIDNVLAVSRRHLSDVKARLASDKRQS